MLVNRVTRILLIAALLLAIPACSKSPEEKRIGAAHASARGQAARAKPFVASMGREPFHRADCKWAKRISVGNLVGYDSRQDAIDDGHRPCMVCGP